MKFYLLFALLIIPLELPSYQRKENYGASETFYQIVRKLAKKSNKTDQLSCNILGPASLGFRHRDDIIEIKKILNDRMPGFDVDALAKHPRARIPLS